jgi:hypothetical protein
MRETGGMEIEVWGGCWWDRRARLAWLRHMAHYKRRIHFYNGAKRAERRDNIKRGSGARLRGSCRQPNKLSRIG